MNSVPDALVRSIPSAERVVEVGVGDRFDVATTLADTGFDVVATDLAPQRPPDGVGFRRDDVTDPDRSIYDGAALVYALRCPPELQGPLSAVAASVGARAAFTTLGGDPATVPVERETVASGTLFWVATDRPRR